MRTKSKRPDRSGRTRSASPTTTLTRRPRAGDQDRRIAEERADLDRARGPVALDEPPDDAALGPPDDGDAPERRRAVHQREHATGPLGHGLRAGGEARGDAIGQRGKTRGLARLVVLTVQRPPHYLLNALGYRDELVEIDPGLDAHRAEAVDEVLAADVPRGARREGAPAQAADGGVEVLHAARHRGEDVRDGHRPRVVRVKRPLDAREARHQVLDDPADLTRVGHARRIGEADRACADVHEAADNALES